MQDDKDDKYEPHEEGEYHFSDEDVTYEAEAEPAKTQSAEVPKESILKQFTQRRLIISGLVFLVLVFAIYKMLAPSATVPPTDIPAVAASQPPTNMAPVLVTQPEQPQQIEPQPTPVVNGVTKEQLDQVSASVDQKFNDLNTQNQTLQNQMQQLDSRVGDMESKLNQLIQLLKQSQIAPPVPTTPGNPFPAFNSNAVQQSQAQAQVVEPIRLPYSVQAIIPGRAWLKSDSGDTITVAEGDSIRELGRIVKIDPYDGVVVINTGNRVVSLSYGSAS